jgi:hypothetical protein
MPKAVLLLSDQYREYARRTLSAINSFAETLETLEYQSGRFTPKLRDEAKKLKYSPETTDEAKDYAITQGNKLLQTLRTLAMKTKEIPTLLLTRAAKEKVPPVLIAQIGRLGKTAEERLRSFFLQRIVLIDQTIIPDLKRGTFPQAQLDTLLAVSPKSPRDQAFLDSLLAPLDDAEHIIASPIPV